MFNEAVETMESLCADFPWTPEFWNSLQWSCGSTASALKDQGTTRRRARHPAMVLPIG